MTRRLVIALLAAQICGCSVNPVDINREPHLTPVGEGLKTDTVDNSLLPPQRRPHSQGSSLWVPTSSDLFRDSRAILIGDVVTVKISIKDKASLDNSSNRSRDSSKSVDFGYGYNIKDSKNEVKTDGTVNADVKGKTESKGKGAISRSESIDLLVAAVVTGVLPNGNLLIKGTQEVRVNYEVRVLSVAGIVRPRDISADNTISYDKIAEARISYGGRGRIMEVQQPSVAQQLLDIIGPF
jgi:flagellar L-ring protein FlgH